MEHQLLPPLSPDEYEALKQDIAKRGVLVPIEIDDATGDVLDGFHRMQACEELNIDPPVIRREFKSEQEKQEHALVLNIMRRQMGPITWANVFKKLAEVRGVELGTKGGRPPKEINRPTIGQLSEEIGVPRSTAEYRLKLAADLEDEPELAEQVDRGEVDAKSALKKVNKPHVTRNTGENEWYTPKEYIQAAREAMNNIDCDPATSEVANKEIRASTYYTIDDDGLEKDWHGNVWMNPPYAQPLVSQFCEKMRDEYLHGAVDQACVLINNATETTFFQSLASCASAICFPKGRVRFIDMNGESTGAPLQGQAVIYLGENPTLFIAEFSCFGMVVTPCHVE